jgi:hypothetical protein
MVMNNILEYLEELKQVTPSAVKVLDRMTQKLHEVNQNNKVASIDTSEEFYTIATRIIDRDRYKNRRILLNQLVSAIQRTEEYDYAPYSDELLTAFDNDNIIKYVIEENTKTVNVVIDPSETCGTLQDYLDAVEIARTNAGAGMNSMQRRSWVWQNIVYKVAREGKTLLSRKGDDISEKMQLKYDDIVAERLIELQGKPAFWYILNYGNRQRPSLGSDTGTPYPMNGPTNFVEHSETLIKYSLNTAIDAEYAKNTGTLTPVAVDDEAERYNKVIMELNEALYNIQSSNPGDVLATLSLADREVEFIVRESKTRGKRLGIKTTKYRSYLD